MTGFLRQSEVCARLGIHVTTWIRWRKAGKVAEPASLPGANKWAESYIDSLKAGGPAKPETKRYFGTHRRAS